MTNRNSVSVRKYSYYPDIKKRASFIFNLNPSGLQIISYTKVNKNFLESYPARKPINS